MNLHVVFLYVLFLKIITNNTNSSIYEILISLLKNTMKKIILLYAFILFSFSTFAQSFLILNELKQNVSNISTTVAGDVNTIIKAQLYVVNDSNITTPLKVKKIENNVLPNTVNTFCFNGECYPPYVMVSSTTIMLQTGDTTAAADFYGDYTPDGALGSTVITYVAFNPNNINDSTYVIVTYEALPASINKPDFTRIDFSNPYPNPASSQTKINYTIPFTYEKATLILRNLIGTNVKEYVIDNPQGRIVLDLSDIKEGIYFYSLVIDGNVILTRKLIKN